MYMSPSLCLTVHTSLNRGKGILVRTIVFATTLCLSAVGLSAASNADAAIKRPTNISAQGLEPALKLLAKERGFQVVYRSEVVGDFQTSGAVGELTADEALLQLLSGTGLIYRYLDENTVTIVPVQSTSKLLSAPFGDVGALEQNRESDDSLRVRDNSLLDVFLLAQANAEKDSAASGANSESNIDRGSGEPARLEEIIVSAQKREERLQDVPIPVSVLAADALVKSNMTNLRDYYNKVPGVSITNSAGGAPVAIIRGITAGGFSNPTVGVAIDDAPFGGSTALAGGYQVIDIDPSDLARVEVLRGPQGTLYGANSLGGLLKYATVDPSLEKTSGRIMMNTQSIRNNDGMGYGLRGSFNTSLTDTLALRASGFTRHDAGFIDDPVHNLPGINEGDAYGGRLSMLWRPSDDVSVKVSALRQVLETGAADMVDFGPSVGEFENSSFVIGAQGSTRKITFLNGTVNVKVGGADLTAVSAYGETDVDMRNSPSGFFIFGTPFGVDAAVYHDVETTSKFSQEIRLAMPLGQRIDWLAGVFYTKERAKHTETITPANFQSGVTVGGLGAIYNAPTPSTYDEIAVFTNFTIHFTDRFDLQVGARQGRNKQTLSQTLSGTLFTLDPFATPPVIGGPLLNGPVNYKDDSLTYLLTPSFKLSPNVMIYSRVASGYRAGGPLYNAPATGHPSVAPDYTYNYELGVKGSADGGLLSFDLSAYYIDWKDIQVQLFNGFTYLDNAGTATSRGVEASVELRPLRGLTLAAWGAWNKAILESQSPDSTVPASPGDKLPYSPRLSGNLSIDYRFPLSAGPTGIVGASVNHVGKRLNDFSFTTREEFPAYTQWDINAGLEVDGWEASVFVNNVTDQRGVISRSGLDSGQIIIKPRTIGVAFTKDF